MSVQPNRVAAKNSAPAIKFVSVTEWTRGRYSRLDIDRMPTNALRLTENTMLDQNGTVTQRPGLKLYGSQPVGTVLGQVFEYVYMNGSTTPAIPESWMIWGENRTGTGTICIAKNGNAATTVSGKTYQTTANFHFEQIYGKVLILNGVDNLSYMDVQTSVITPFAALTTPGGPTATANGIAGSVYFLRYRVSAANQGETAASTATVVGVTAQRQTWNGTTQNVSLSGSVPTGANRINIYVGDTAGNEWYLDTISVTGLTTWSYTDTGSIFVNTNRSAPVGDSTAGPRATRATNIKGQVFMVGDSDNPGRVWFGGYGQNALDFSSYNGGGWVEPNKGGKDLPSIVKAFRDGKGTPMAACLSKGTNGAGKRYLLQPTTTTLGTTTIAYMAVQEDNGADGTDSPDAVVFVDDALIYPSRTGFKSTSTKPQIQNILSTQAITDNVSSDVTTLSAANMGQAVAVVNDRKIHFALPVLSSTNNQIWTLDLRQNGAWYFPWYIAAKWLWLYADNTDGTTKLLALVNNQFVQFDSATQTNDLGVAFSTSAGSGAIKFSDDGEIWGSVVDVTFVFLRPQGNINLSVDAYTEDGTITYSDTMKSSAKQAVSGWGQYGWGSAGWGNLSPYASPLATSAANPRKTWTIPIDEECNMITWAVSTTDAGVSYQLSEIVIRYVPLGFKELDNS